MSGTDPKGKWFGKKGDPTSAFSPDGEKAPDHGQTLPPDLPKIPGITLHYEIARGGMGVVYSGRQDFLDRRVAVKFLSMDLGGASFAQRFQREAKILAGISHPNIVGCHMADTTDEGQSYLVMEFCDGPSLKAWINDNGPVAPMASLRLIRASAQALAHAYQSAIIHRDVKPENILLETVTSTSIDIKFPFTPKIVDLGLARMAHEQVGEGLTSPGSVMGTPSTMSPEQFDDPDSVDFRSDIYGLGCCLYEMLVGQPAFRGTKLTDIVVKKRSAEAPNPCAEMPNIPAAVGAFTQRLLACSREDRPATYKEFDREIEDLMKALVTAPGAAFGERPSEPSGLDQTIPSGQGAFQTKAVAGGDLLDQTIPSGKPAQAGKPAQGAGTKQVPKGGGTSPGMLNTGELDFLSAGGDAGSGGSAPPPQFQEQGTSPTQPGGGGKTGGNKSGLVIGVGLAVVAVVVGGVMFLGGDGNSANGGNGGTPNKSNSASTSNDSGANATKPNTLPVIAAINLLVAGEVVAQPVVDQGSEFELVVEASDADGDDIEYDWSWPLGVASALSASNDARLKLRLDDGLPGVVHTISVEVQDGRAAEPVKRDIQVTVGKCQGEMSFVALYAAKTLREVSGRWSSWATPPNQQVTGRFAKGEVAVLSAKLGDEAYWEWEGLMTPMGGATGVGSGGVYVKFGAAGYGVSVTVSDTNRDENGFARATDWTIEVQERVPGSDNEWRPHASKQKVVWVQQRSSDSTSRAGFSVRRVGNQLTLRMGEYILNAPQDGKELEAKILWQPPVTIDLTEEVCRELAKSGEVQLQARENMCEFRGVHR